MRRKMIVIAVAFTGCLQAVHAQMPLPSGAPSTAIVAPSIQGEFPLYPSAPAKGGAPEQWSVSGTDRSVRNVTVPTLTPMLPEPAKATGLGILVVPGGGFRLLAIDNEGYGPAKWLADHGIAAFVLKYRTMPVPREGAGQTMPGMAAGAAAPNGPGGAPVLGPGGGLGPGGATAGDSPRRALPADSVADGRAAIEFLRSRALEWKIDPAKIGMLGFSAGAEITLEISMGAEPNGKPDFVGSIYGPLAPRTLPSNLPPLFAVMALNDPVMGPRGIGLIAQYRDAKGPAEFHLYEKGGHAFGMKKQGTTSDQWPEEFLLWIKDRGLLAPGR